MKSPRLPRYLSRAGAAFALLSLAPQLAFAADPPTSDADPASAGGLFYAARTLMQEGRFAEACPKLEESVRLDPGLGTQFNLADCNEHVGKVATAWAGFLEVAAAAKASNQPGRESLARKRAAVLERRLPKLVVDASGATAGLEVRRDGIVVASAAWGTPVPVDPGTHRIVANAPGKQTWETTISTPEGQTVRVSVPRKLLAAPVVVAAATGVAGVDAAVPATATPANVVAPYFPPAVVESPGSAQGTVGWVVMGVGAAGLGLGAAFGLTSLGKRDEARDHCKVDRCDSRGLQLRDDAIRTGNVATIATIAGAGAFVGGLILLLAAPGSTETPFERTGKIRATPTVAVGGGGFTLNGVFQ